MFHVQSLNWGLIIRRTVFEKKQPTHLMVLNYIKENYDLIFRTFSEKILTQIKENKICDCLNKYSVDELSDNKKILIKRYLLEKCKMLERVYLDRVK